VKNMSELYPYCSQCDNELTEEEQEMNKKYEIFFYPICFDCLNKHEKNLKEIGYAEEENEE
jgi:hypothetical protein